MKAIALDVFLINPPPSYKPESVYSRLKTARAETDSVGDFFCRAVSIIASTIAITVVLVVLLAVPVSMLVVGSLFVHDCPADRMIPIYLLVGGAFTTFRTLASLAMRLWYKSREDQDKERKKSHQFLRLLDLFNVAWFIAGCVFIYRTKDEFSPHRDDPGKPFCDHTLYWFAFWINTAHFIVIVLVCSTACFILCLAAILKRQQ